METFFSLSQKIMEFPQAKEIVSGFSHWPGGKEGILDLTPLDEIDDIYSMQNKVRQLQEINASGDLIPLGGFADITSISQRAFKGSVLTNEEFLLILSNLRIAASVRKSLVPWMQMPFIYSIIQELYSLPELLRSIEYIFDESGSIKDSASSELLLIRKGIREIEASIAARIGGILRDTSRQKMFQEQLYTVREGRYVIPIRQEYKGVFDGLVQDISSSGATIFMEPIEVVELNNRLRQYIVEEKTEVDRILRTLSDHVGRNHKELISNHELIKHLDTIYALSLYADKNKCTLPEIGNGDILYLKNARHPLLGEKAVPLELELGNSYKIMIITGPNTGGKTVALKTAGLISFMALSGMPVPASEGTKIPLFSGIYADIGDDQSISQNLSTFSSHMNKIISIIKEAKAGSLVLLDELGAGTDPREGSAIAISLLEHLASAGILTIVTTHYGELKYFASNHPLACNAAMEFDENTLLPSYRIITGLPGRSCALTIAGRLGFPDSLLQRAQELLTHEYIEMDKLLANIESKEKVLDTELNLHKKLRKEADLLKEKYENEMTFVKTEQLELFAESAAQVETMVHSAKNEIQEILKSFSKKLQAARKSENPGKISSQLYENTSARLDEILQRLELFKKKQGVKSIEPDEIKAGDEVFVPSMNKNASVLEIKGDDLLIAINRIKMRVNRSGVRTAAKKNIPSEKVETNTFIEKNVSPAASPSLNLIGMYTDEAVYMLEKYIEEMKMQQTYSFLVVHGKGTGALRNAVHNFLRKNKDILSFRLGLPAEGRDGVTAVVIKDR